VNQNYARRIIWKYLENTKGLKVPTEKSSRIIICHAGSSGFGFVKEAK